MAARAAFFLAAAPVALAQPAAEGRVVDAETDAPVPGAHVLVEGTALGTTTDRAGRFVLLVPEAGGAVRLVVSSLGYRTETVAAERGTPILVRLEPTLLDLQPVVVSASRSAEARSAAPVAIAALTAADLAATKPNLLSDALNRMPGVYMVDLGGEQHAMSIRQPISYRALYVYLEDGIPIRPVGLFNHNALIEMNMEGVDRVEVVRGPSSSLYGSNAVGGAVNFVTPAPTDALTGRVALRGSDAGYRRADLEASGTVGRVGVWAGGYFGQQRDGLRAHSDYDKASVTARADVALGAGTRLTGTLTTSHLDTDTDGALDSLSFARFGDGGGLTSLQTFTYRTVDATRAALRLDRAWNARHGTEVTAFFRDNAVGQLPHYRIRRNQADPAAATGEENLQSFHSLGLDAQHRLYLPGGLRVIGGATLDRSPSSYYATFIAVQRDPETGVYTGYTPSDSLLTDYDVDLLGLAAYAQVDARPLPGLRLVGGLRYDHLRYDYDNHLPPSAFSGAPDQVDTFGRLSPRLGATLDLGHDRGLYANASQGFVPPDVGELYRGVQVPALRPAHFTSYEAGGWAAFLDGRLALDLAVYRMDGTDEIISVRLPDDSSVNANAGATRHYGVEYAVAVAPVPAVTLRLSGTNAVHEFLEHEANGVPLDGNEMDAAPDWIANAEAAYRPPFLRGARAAVEWQHVGAYFMDPENTRRYPGHDVLNLRLSYDLGAFEVWGHALNLTDALYATVASYGRFGASYTPGLPRSFVVGVRYALGR
jgi:outer membrane receptor protein involved in Fe transport